MKFVVNTFRFFCNGLKVLGLAMKGQYKTSNPKLDTIRKEMMDLSLPNNNSKNLQKDLRHAYGDIRIAVN